MRTLLVIVLGLLAGCASSGSGGWTKPGITEQQLGRDTSDCLLDARVVEAGRDGPRTRVNQDRYRLCMAGRGYTAGPPK